MICPQCGATDTQVVDSRDTPESVRRRRLCSSCKARFTTHERIEPTNLIVQKRNGDTERFDPEKIRRGVRLSCKNRPIPSSDIDGVAQRVIQGVALSGKEMVTSSEIGEIVQKELRLIDPIAYLRFTSVYQAFANLEEFEQAIQSIHT